MFLNLQLLILKPQPVENLKKILITSYSMINFCWKSYSFCTLLVWETSSCLLATNFWRNALAKAGAFFFVIFFSSFLFFINFQFFLCQKLKQKFRHRESNPGLAGESRMCYRLYHSGSLLRENKRMAKNKRKTPFFFFLLTSKKKKL
jgi:hypothetical protein